MRIELFQRRMNLLDKLAVRKRPILACLLQPGDIELPYRHAEICVENGADILEVSLPCKHPYLDGAVVTQSMQRALATGMSQRRMELELSMLRERVSDTAIVLMGYRNLKLSRVRRGYEAYRSVDGILQVGSSTFRRLDSTIASGPHAIHRIGFVSDRLNANEIASAKRAGGYVMLQAAGGKTGTRRTFSKANAAKVARLREAGVAIPILLGFGISTPAHAREALRCGADGVIVGSACTVHARTGAEKLQRFIADLRAVLDGAR